MNFKMFLLLLCLPLQSLKVDDIHLILQCVGCTNFCFVLLTTILHMFTTFHCGYFNLLWLLSFTMVTLIYCGYFLILFVLIARRKRPIGWLSSSDILLTFYKWLEKLPFFYFNSIVWALWAHQLLINLLTFLRTAYFYQYI